MVIDLFRCVACQSCTVACKAENYTSAGVSWHRVMQQEYGTYPTARRSFVPMPCMHCDNTPCLKVCPTGATYKRNDGIVLVDYSKCIGCKYCMQACPYGARQFNDGDAYFPEIGLTAFEKFGGTLVEHVPGTAEKCTFCAHRIDEGVKNGLKPGVDPEATPACVNACPTNARIFGDLDDSNSRISRIVKDYHAEPLRPEFGTRPSVYYLPPSRSVIKGELKW